MEIKLHLLIKTSFLDSYLTIDIKIKIQKRYCTSTRHTQSYPRVSLVYYLKCKWSWSDKPYMTENVIVRPSFDPWRQNIQNPYCTSAGHAKSYHRVSFDYSWKCNWCSLDKRLKSKPSKMALFQKLKICCEIRATKPAFQISLFFAFPPEFSFYEHLKYALNFRQWRWWRQCDVPLYMLLGSWLNRDKKSWT